MLNNPCHSVAKPVKNESGVIWVQTTVTELVCVVNITGTHAVIIYLDTFMYHVHGNMNLYVNQIFLCYMQNWDKPPSCDIQINVNAISDEPTGNYHQTVQLPFSFPWFYFQRKSSQNPLYTTYSAPHSKWIQIVTSW